MARIIKVWVDSYTLNVATERGVNIIGKMKAAKVDGFDDSEVVFVTADTMADVAAFQQNTEEVEKMIKNGLLVVERFYDDYSKMTAKNFVWSSCGLTTVPAESFEEAISDLPNKLAISELSVFAVKYGINKKGWIEGRPAWAPPEKLSEEACTILGLTADASRSDVLEKAKALNCMEIFDKFNAGYCKALAKQHDCTAMLTVSGSIMMIS